MPGVAGEAEDAAAFGIRGQIEAKDVFIAFERLDKEHGEILGPLGGPCERTVGTAFGDAEAVQAVDFRRSFVGSAFFGQDPWHPTQGLNGREPWQIVFGQRIELPAVDLVGRRHEGRDRVEDVEVAINRRANGRRVVGRRPLELALRLLRVDALRQDVADAGDGGADNEDEDDGETAAEQLSGPVVAGG